MRTIHVEEKARAKDTHGKGVESSSANVVQKKKQYTFRNKKKNKQGTNPMTKQTTTLRRKRQTRAALFAVAMSIVQVLN